ncbi:MAG: (Fe-S)-binding protein [Chloroflexi bacterium]|nr:(Fe-S)-binding protein [Chloroflexota bacterium]
MKSAYSRLEEEVFICARCGYCRSACPVYQELGWESNSPGGKVSLAKGLCGRGKIGLPQEYIRKVYQCTLCGNCRQVCATRIELRHLWLDLRQRIAQADQAPSPLKQMRQVVNKCRNIVDQRNEERLAWSLDLPQAPASMDKGGTAPLVYFVGCVSSFFPMVFSIPQAFVQILKRAGLEYVILGGQEWCCGFPLMAAGMQADVRDLVAHNMARVREAGAEGLVTTCPSCYHTWAHDYAAIAGQELGFKVQHASEFLEELVRGGVIRLSRLEDKVTYHDPCDLGRNSDIYEAPRRLIRSIPGISLVEMRHNRDQALCCGGGGDLEMNDPDLTAALARRRLQEALGTGATHLLSACQQCQRTLGSAARKERLRLKVTDVVELVWKAMQGVEGPG